MNVIKLYWACCLFLSINAGLRAQMLSSSALREDLQLLKESILDYNPAVDFYTPDFIDLADELIEEVKDSVSVFEAFSLISRMCASANEGHFELGTWADPVHRGIRDDIKPFFPIAIYLVDEVIYVRGDFSNEGYLSPGDRILSINGIPTGKLLQHLRNHIPTDGYIETYANQRIASSFPWLYFFYVQQARQFTIEYTPRGTEEIKTVVTQAQTRAQRKANALRRYSVPESKGPSRSNMYTMEYFDTVAVLKLKSFDYRLVEEFDIKADKLYKDLFKECNERGIRHLVIDLRNNRGGRLEFGEEIVPYIMKTDQEHDYLVQSISWKGKVRTERMPRMSNHAFLGQLYALVNGETYSTGATVARYLREYGEAKIIGEEGGTRYEGFVAGSSQYVFLPNSQIRIGIPCYHKEYPPSEVQQTENRGIIPDRRISQTIDDIMKSKDVVMDYTLSLIRSGR